jgi:hypothetical protein
VRISGAEDLAVRVLAQPSFPIEPPEDRTEEKLLILSQVVGATVGEEKGRLPAGPLRITRFEANQGH